jgi:cysteine desulfurase
LERSVEVYFDAAATTPLTSTVKELMIGCLDVYGNPSSLHRKGMEAEVAVSKARRQILRALGATQGQIVFTSGGTEADNLAIFGSAYIRAKTCKHIVSTAIEHPAVLEPLRALMKEGFEVTFVKPTPQGDILVEDMISAVRENTVLVSMMHVNNETGAILPVKEVGDALVHRPKTLFHVDGTQAFGKLPVNVHSLQADLYTLSGHKVGGPKGIGALYVREGIPLEPRILGGGQENGTRSGTENVLGALAMGQAVKDAGEFSRTVDAQFMTDASRDMAEHLKTCGFKVYQPKNASPYIVLASLPGIRGEVIVHAFESAGLYVSTGSACSSKHAKSSHVLTAMGVAKEEQMSCIRLSFHPQATKQEFMKAKAVIKGQTEWLQRMMGRFGT